MPNQPPSCPAYEIPARLDAVAHAVLDEARAAQNRLGRVMAVVAVAAVRDILTGHEPNAPFDAARVELVEGKDSSLYPTGRYWTLSGDERTLTETVGETEAGNGVHGMSEWTVYLDDSTRDAWRPLCTELPDRHGRPAWALDLIRAAALPLDEPAPTEPRPLNSACPSGSSHHPA